MNKEQAKDELIKVLEGQVMKTKQSTRSNE
jgi:hypothetical protein